MHDLGSFAVRGAAPLLAHFLKADDETFEEALNDMRTDALKRPQGADEVSLASVIRLVAWMFLMLGALALFIVASFARPDTPSTLTSALEVVMTVVAVVGYTFIGMMLMSLWRYILSKILSGQLRARLDDNPAPKLGLVGWLTIPNSVDLLPALLFMLCLAPPVFP
ncbi:MAG TPA: hypothetical protein VES42_05620 [Pilimelia sp.]|nr:hypothetical protein [Pilimelia sp.]